MEALLDITAGHYAKMADGPPQVRERVEALLAENDHVESLRSAAHEQGEQHRRALTAYRDRERRIVDDLIAHGGKRDPGEAAAAAAEEQRLVRAVNRASESGKALIDRGNAAVTNFNEALRLLNRVGHHIEVVPTKLKGSAQDILREAVPKHGELRRERTRTRMASPPKDEHLADRMAELAELAAQPLLSISSGHTAFPAEAVAAAPDALRDLETIPAVSDVRPLLARVHHDVLAEELRRLVDAKYARIELTMTAAEKISRVMELDAEILATERLIAEATWAARAEGIDIGFPILDPRAILGIKGPAPRKSSAQIEEEDDEVAIAAGF